MFQTANQMKLHSGFHSAARCTPDIFCTLYIVALYMASCTMLYPVPYGDCRGDTHCEGLAQPFW